LPRQRSKSVKAFREAYAVAPAPNDDGRLPNDYIEIESWSRRHLDKALLGPSSFDGKLWGRIVWTNSDE
jgi:hypothetical protein